MLIAFSIFLFLFGSCGNVIFGYIFFFEKLCFPLPKNPMFLSVMTSSKNMLYSKIPLDSFDRILRSVYTNTSNQIHIQINQSIYHVISCVLFGDAVCLAGLLQKPSKFLVLTTLLSNNFNPNETQNKFFANKSCFLCQNFI